MSETAVMELVKVLIVGLMPTITIIVTHVLNRKSRRRSTARIVEKLDAIALSNEKTVTACDDVVGALREQNRRLQRRSDVTEHDDRRAPPP